MTGTVSPAIQTPLIIAPSLATTISVIAAIHVVTSSIQRVGCSSSSSSSSSSPGGASGDDAHRNSSSHRGHQVAPSSSSRDLPHPMRLRRAPTTAKRDDGGEGGGGGSGTRRFPCYACRYVAESSGFTVGSPDCNDPFVPLQITEVMCGASCFKMVRRSSDGSLSVARGCERGCVDREDDAGFNRCCRSKFCNGSAPLRSRAGHVTAAVVCSALLSRLLVARLSSASS